MAGLVNVDVGGVLGSVFDLVDELFTSDEERLTAKYKVMELQAKGQLAQLSVNAKEAEHKSLFVAGWRPFIGWVCGAAFAWNFIFYPFLSFISWALFQWGGIDFPVETLPVLDLSTMIPVLMGMLGLGAMRTYEKKNGVASSNMGFSAMPTPPFKPEGGIY